MKLAPQFWLLLVATVVVNAALCWSATVIDDDPYDFYLAFYLTLGQCLVQTLLLGAWLVLGELWWPKRMVLVGIGLTAWTTGISQLIPPSESRGLMLSQIVVGVLVGSAWRSGKFRWRNLNSFDIGAASFAPRPRQFSLGAILGLMTACAVGMGVATHAKLEVGWSFFFSLFAMAGMTSLGLWALTTPQRTFGRYAGILGLGLSATAALAHYSRGVEQQLLLVAAMYLTSALFVILWVEVCRSAQLLLVREDHAANDVPA